MSQSVKGSFQFIPPTKVKVTGSFLHEMCVKPNIHVDLVLEMPKVSLFSFFFLEFKNRLSSLQLVFSLYIIVVQIKFSGPGTLRSFKVILKIEFCFFSSNWC